MSIIIKVEQIRPKGGSMKGKAETKKLWSGGNNKDIKQENTIILFKYNWQEIVSFTQV